MEPPTVCRLLLVEDDPGDANLVRQLLKSSKKTRFEITTATCLEEATRLLQNGLPDILLLDLSLPDSFGIHTVNACHAQAAGIPIVVLTGNDDLEFALQTLEAGAQDYLIKGSFDTEALSRAIRHAICRARLENRLVESEERFHSMADSAPAMIWIAGPDQQALWFNRTWLAFTGKKLEEELGEGWTEHLHPEDRQRIMLEYRRNFDARTAFQLVYRLQRQDGEYRWINDTGTPRVDGKGGFCGFIGLGMDITEQRAMQQELERQARFDYLTGLPNRRHFLEQAEMELARTHRYNSGMSMLMLDIDFFKSVNDNFGHKSGDLVLQQVSHACQETLREIDIPARLGGEEFAILLPETDLAHAFEVAERLRHMIASMQIALPDGQHVQITISIGVSTYQDENTSIDSMLNLADQALYQAKHQGRNRVVTA